MRIRTFDEVDPFEVHKLLLASFGWAAPEAKFLRQIRTDPRTMEGYAVYAVERGRVLAQVLPLKMPVRLTTGVETVGGVAAVCSHPDVWGQGYLRGLMDHVHGMYRDAGLRIAALTTSRNIRGYGVYRKLGYVDLAPFYRATKRIARRPRRPGDVRLRTPRWRDLPRIQGLFRGFSRGLYGWTERHPRFLGGGQIWLDNYLGNFRLVYRAGELVGYFVETPGEADCHQEFVIRRRADLRATLAGVEAEARHGLSTIDCLSCDRDLKRFRELGYDIVGPTTYKAMAIPLRRGVASRDLPRLFGATLGRFLLYPTDSF